MPVFSDVNHSTPTDKPLTEDVTAVYQSLENILSTRKRQRLFKPTFGADLEDLLFELMTDETTLEILSVIVRDVEFWETRVKLLVGKCDVTPHYDKNEYEVKLIFQLHGIEEEFELSGVLGK